jgi:protein Tex
MAQTLTRTASSAKIVPLGRLPPPKGSVMPLTDSELTAAIAAELGLRPEQVGRTIALFDEGNTIPFVARYRKEVTGGLDEEQLRAVAARAEYLRNLADRKRAVLESIAEQDKLTDDLRARIEAAPTLQEVEDLYLPYRPKRRTRATVARERGLGPLAEMILAQEATTGTPALYAANFVSEEVPTVEEALAGARDIVAEVTAEDAEARGIVRRAFLADAVLASRQAKGANDPDGKYRLYYEYAERLAAMPPHRVLAVNRGEREGVLQVSVETGDDAIVAALQRRVLRRPDAVFRGELLAAVADGYQRLMRPSIEREARAARTEAAEAHAIRVFGANLRQLLLQPPLRGVRVLAIDPGFRTGSKVAVVDETGRYLDSVTIYPHEPQKRWAEAKYTLAERVARHGVGVVAIGNGTASRETEALVAEAIAEGLPESHVGRMKYIRVSEAGASVYSASKLAGSELPQLDVSIRGAVSIARRLQDPLAELVKIDPKSIGVGLYQHDVNQKALAEALDAVVESAVNYVGVDANTASPALLRYVAGIGPRLAAAIVAHRDANGPFARRCDLIKVKGLGAKAFQQAAGFLKVVGDGLSARRCVACNASQAEGLAGDEPLDNTFIHPESYPACYALLGRMGLTGREAGLARRVHEGWAALRTEGVSEASLAAELGIGVPTLQDMVANLLKPGRDPREDLPAPILRTDVLKMEDLREGMMLKGTVRNVVDFGAFVDIGVKQDGLVHVSQMAERYVRDPLEVVSVGDIVDVRVISVDLERGRIGLSMKS